MSAMKRFRKLCFVLFLAGAFVSPGAAQEIRKPIPFGLDKAARVIKQPDVTVWIMKATLTYTSVGRGAATPIDRVKLEYTFKNIGDADLPNQFVDASFYKDGHHLETWSLTKLAPGETKQWWEYREFPHGQPVTFAVQLHPSATSSPVESQRGMSNNRMEIVIGEAEDTILHAGGEIRGHFAPPQ